MFVQSIKYQKTEQKNKKKFVFLFKILLFLSRRVTDDTCDTCFLKYSLRAQTGKYYINNIRIYVY